MNRPTCPSCGAKPFAAFIQPNFTCATCHARLSSNIRVVTFVEWLVGIVPFLLIAAAILKTEAFAGWSFVQVLLLLFTPACIVHWLVLCHFLKLSAEPANES